MRTWKVAVLEKPLLWWILALSVSSCSPLTRFQMPEDLPARVEFNRDIRPVLSDKCYACHGPDAGARKAHLRLDTRAGAVAVRDGYDQPAVVPGSPRGSALAARILDPHPDRRMPPPEKDEVGSGGKVLTEREKGLLIRWIEQGAPWDQHWAYKPLVRPELPLVRETDRVRVPIDHFIVARLKQAGLEPSPEADRSTLLRRLSLDLTGLPPTPTEVQSFAESTDPGTYEQLVDRLLASPHFGERMAVFWLDLVRYADTNGYHSDVHRRIWPYRDYVIRSFNENKPFDKFTTEQLAGDLLPDPTPEQRIATGFNRLGQTTKEGGSQSKEYLAMYAADRVRTVSTTWLGSTMACAECHDHKFDPFTQKDFYKFAAFFADIKEQGLFLNDPLMFPERALRPGVTDKQREELHNLESRLAYLYERGSSKEKKALPRLQERFDRLSDQLQVTLVTEAVEPRVVRLLPRGDWRDDSGEIVGPGVPAALPPLTVAGQRATRKDLADWLVSPENPLTARVFVNHLWKEIFGTGLSATPGDLGSQGDWPTHPELLDWLAVEFRESGWDVKHVVRQIVRSHTYRQSSIPTPRMLETDAGNRLLARQSRFRLKAELIRDNALAISGLLTRRVGGPSIKPYQPEDYWKDIQTFGVGGPGSEWLSSSGEDQYRRGLYIYWKRSFLHPSLKAFDAPERQECTATRPRSNTPTQALVLLNDPTYVEAARVFAQNLLASGEAGFEQRLNEAFRRAVARVPEPSEFGQMRTFFDRQLERFRKDPAAARLLTQVGQYPISENLDLSELAAWTSLCRAILNLHETITRS